MVYTSAQLLELYRQDAIIPHFASGGSSGFAPSVSPLTKPLFTFGTSTNINPNVTQSQDISPRDTGVTTGASVNSYSTFNTPLFIMIAIILAVIYFLS